jgi:hypothetical protein
MGFFSWNCRHCGDSLVSHHAVSPGHPRFWQVAAVAVRKDGGVLEGDYDGYGRIGDVDLMQPWRENGCSEKTSSEYLYPVRPYDVPRPEVYHAECFRALGPLPHRKPSRNAFDQGYFFEG